MTKLANETINTATIGNFYDSRLAGHDYSCWTSGYDVCFSIDGTEYYYQLRNYTSDRVCKIEPVVLEDAQAVKWNDINSSVKEALFDDLFPEADRFEKNLFVYGKELGQQMNADINWASNHTVFDEYITLELVKYLGAKFEKVQFIKEYALSPGTGYRIYEYLVDEKYLVEVETGKYCGGKFYNDFKVKNYADVKKEQKAFGQRVAKLAKKAKMPWKIAKFVGHIKSDEEAIKILEAVKAARGTADNHLKWELCCGIDRRVNALEQILGKTWSHLKCSGQNQTSDLAGYILGE